MAAKRGIINALKESFSLDNACSSMQGMPICLYIVKAAHSGQTAVLKAIRAQSCKV